VTEHHPTHERPLTDLDRLRKALLATAKFIDITVTKSDPLLSELEAAFGGNDRRMAEVAHAIVNRAWAVRHRNTGGGPYGA